MDYETWKATWKTHLNPQQEAAVQAAEGPVLLLAVPGSGKTTVLLHRLGYLIFCRGVAPEHLLTVTYTVAATRDMSARFARLFGEELAGRVEFRTINGLSARIIRYYERTKGRQAFQLAPEGQLFGLVAELCRAVTGHAAPDAFIRAVRTEITYCKNQQLSREEIQQRPVDDEYCLGPFYQRYQQAMRSRKWMDYDDQMVYAARILRQYPDILQAFQQRYRYLSVDEAQDTSRIQHTILSYLAGPGGNLFQVGDEDQSIYGFRAADPGALLQFEEDFPGGRVLFLETNYRSTSNIVAEAGRVIRHNQHRREKTMVAARGAGKPVQALWVEDQAEQYRTIAQMAKTCREETAVLYRNNDSALPLLDLLDRQGTGFRCRQMEGTFFTHPVVRCVRDCYRAALHPQDPEVFLRLNRQLPVYLPPETEQWAIRSNPPEGSLLETLSRCPGLEEGARHRCAAFARQLRLLPGDRGDEAIRRIQDHIATEALGKEREKEPNLWEIQGVKARAGKAAILETLGRSTPSLEALLRRLEELQVLVRQGGDQDPESPLILSTIHGSKGLEYHRVVLMDLVDGLLPSWEWLLWDVVPQEKTEVQREEERRLFYVAITRAKDELCLFRFRTLPSTFGEELFPGAFQKVEELWRKLRAYPKAEKGNPGAPWKGKAVQGPPLDLSRFDLGARVIHRRFGEGIVAGRQGEIATIVFDRVGEKRVSLAVAVRKGVLKWV